MKRHRSDDDAARPPSGRSAPRRAERPQPQLSQSHEFLEHLRHRLGPEVASLKGLQRAIEDERPGTGQAYMPAVGAAPRSPRDGRGHTRYGAPPERHLPAPPRKKKKGAATVPSGPDLGWINDQMRGFVADASAEGPLCFEKFGKARRKTVRTVLSHLKP